MKAKALAYVYMYQGFTLHRVCQETLRGKQALGRAAAGEKQWNKRTRTYKESKHTTSAFLQDHFRMHFLMWMQVTALQS